MIILDYPGRVNVITRERQRIRVRAEAVRMEAEVGVVSLLEWGHATINVGSLRDLEKVRNKFSL